MKKVMTFAMITTLTIASIAEAKRAGGMRSSGASRSLSTLPAKKNTQQNTQQQTQQKKADADFNNTPPLNNQAAAQPARQGASMGNFITGAAAGYLLSEALSSSTAQAQEQTQAVATEAQNATAALTEQVAQIPAIAQFRSIDPNDPFLIEKTNGYLRYCLNGVQYLVSAINPQLAPTLMVDKTGAPVQCQIVQ